MKLLTGNPGKRPLNMHEPKPEPGVRTVLPNLVQSRGESGTALQANRN